MNKVGDTLLHYAPNEKLVRALIEEGVEFIVIGGLAVAWYCSERQADDMDLLVNPTQDNSARIHSALSKLGLNGFTTLSFACKGVQAPLKIVYYAELLTPKKGGCTYHQVLQGIVHGKLFGMPVQIASIPILIILKEQAVASTQEQLDKHLSDIERLKARTP